MDLDVFRRRAVGDRLRAVYDQLSRDPNSLANLDQVCAAVQGLPFCVCVIAVMCSSGHASLWACCQDLPNYAQHAVPIFSLPEEWLWCESWCSDSSKSKAKTIDLCNNPLHKVSPQSLRGRALS